MYDVVDFYENPFGERIYISHELDDARCFAKMWAEETDGECSLVILDEERRRYSV